MKQRVYLDTSVISALDDMRWPERAELTRSFWANREMYEVSTCEVAREEIERTSDPQRLAQMLLLLDEIVVHPLTPEMDDLANEFVVAGVFPGKVLDDALHVAAAVLTRSEILLSWNFKHLVNRRGRAAVHSIVLARGLPPVEIISPPEL